MISGSIVKRRVNSMFYDLYQYFADYIGEDVSIKILEMSGFIVIDMSANPRGNSSYYFGGNPVQGKLNDLFDYYNLTYEPPRNDNFLSMYGQEYMGRKDKRFFLEKRIRNYCFRHNIKIYDISEVIYDNKLKLTKLPIGRAFEHRPIIHDGKRIKLLNYTKFMGNHYIVVGYFDEDVNGFLNFDIARIN